MVLNDALFVIPDPELLLGRRDPNKEAAFRLGVQIDGFGHLVDRFNLRRRHGLLRLACSRRGSGARRLELHGGPVWGFRHWVAESLYDGRSSADTFLNPGNFVGGNLSPDLCRCTPPQRRRYDYGQAGLRHVALPSFSRDAIFSLFVSSVDPAGLLQPVRSRNDLRQWRRAEPLTSMLYLGVIHTAS